MKHQCYVRPTTAVSRSSSSSRSNSGISFSFVYAPKRYNSKQHRANEQNHERCSNHPATLRGLSVSHLIPVPAIACLTVSVCCHV